MSDKAKVRLTQLLVFVILFAAIADILVVWSVCNGGLPHREREFAIFRLLREWHVLPRPLTSEEFWASPAGKERLEKIRNGPFQGAVGLPY